MIKRITTTCFLLVSLLSANVQAEALSTLSADLERLDNRFRAFSSELYQNYVGKNGRGAEVIDNPVRLETRVRALLAQGDQLGAIATITRNKALVLSRVNRNVVEGFIKLLLDHNEWQLANELHAHIKDSGLGFQVINVNYVFAKFHFRRSEWALCIKALQKISRGRIASANMDFYNLMYGISLQQVGRYEQAIKYYRLVTPASGYRGYSELNETSSRLNQKSSLEQIEMLQSQLTNKAMPMPHEVSDYLSLLAGYHFLEKGQLEAARAAFGRVSTRSRYFNRALLGVAYVVSQQKDYSRALSYALMLKKKDSTGLAVDESYLLSADILSKSQRLKMASAAYSEAMEYYGDRIQQIDNFLGAEMGSDAVFELVSDIDLMHEYPEARSLFDNMKHLGVFLVESDQFASDHDFYRQISQLYSEYSTIIEAMVKRYMKQRRSYLESYLSQSRFGLVQMFDMAESRHE